MIKILFLVWIGLIAGTSLASNNGSVFLQSSALPDFLRFTTNPSTCSTAVQGCASCKSATECLYCEGGWSLMNGQCVLCSTITPNCYYCNEGLCSGCQEGYYQTTNFTCSPCSDSNCIECLGGGCTTCKSRFYSLNGQCTTCPVGCYSCYSGNGCTSCENGYFHNNTVRCSNLCVSCDPSGCSACVPGAYMYNSDCLACPDGCYECISPIECTSCYFFYKLSSSGNCSSEYLTLGIAIILSIILTYLIFRQFRKLKVKKSEMTSSLSKEETVIKIPRNIGVFACCALTLAFTGIIVLLYWAGTRI